MSEATLELAKNKTPEPANDCVLSKDFAFFFRYMY